MLNGLDEQFSTHSCIQVRQAPVRARVHTLESGLQYLQYITVSDEHHMPRFKRRTSSCTSSNIHLRELLLNVRYERGAPSEHTVH